MFTDFIDDSNIHGLVRTYIKNKLYLPLTLRKIPMGKWDVSRVTNMEGLFMNLDVLNESLDESLEEWNVSNVTNMKQMFFTCSRFNQPLNKWNVSNVTTMEQMFYRCYSFNQPLDNWNVSNVNDMNYMFKECISFNNRLNGWGLTVGNVTNMESMFNGCRNFNQPLNSWNVINVTNMKSMFYGCKKFNQPLNSWNVINVTNMERMFADCDKFNLPLTAWNVNNVTNYDRMFLNGIMQEEFKPPGLRPRPRLDPNQVHKASSKINFNTLNRVLIANNPTQIETPSDYAKYIQNTLLSFIYESGEPVSIKKAQKKDLRSIMDAHLIRLNYSQLSPILRTTLVNALEYVKRQPTEFQQAYVNAFIHDCIHAHEGGRGMTCATGALERITLSLVHAAVSQLSTATTPNAEYQELIDIIEANPEKMIPENIRVWYKLHKKGTEGAFPPGTSEATKRDNLKEFLLSKFPGEVALIDAKIAEIADNIGYEEDDFDVMYGGKRKRKTRRIKKTNRKKKTIRKH